MSELEPYFADTLSDDERLINSQALCRGAFTGLRYFLDRLASYYDLLELELDEKPAGQIYLKESAVALARATKLVDSVAEYGSNLKRDFESFDLCVLIEGIARRMQQIDLAAVQFQKITDDDQAVINGRQFMFQQLLFELPHLFTSKPDTLHSRLSVTHLDDIFFQGHKSPLKAGEYYLLTFAPDAAPELQHCVALMEKLFSGGDIELNDRMVFVYGMVLEHGGDLFVAKDTAGIQSITLVLPTVRNTANMFGDAPLDESELRGDETVLLVDDEGIIWDVVIDLLQKLGYTVILAENGADCVEIYRENPGEIDLVLLDMVMPKMNGHEAYFKLKDIDPDVKVILQSGYIDQKEAQDVLKSGALGFLQKPYRMQDLARKIRQVFD